MRYVRSVVSWVAAFVVALGSLVLMPASFAMGSSVASGSFAPLELDHPVKPKPVIRAETVLSPRLRELEIDSPAMGGMTKVRVLLPAYFEDRATQEWPALMMLHGYNSSYEAWTTKKGVTTTKDNIAEVTTPYDVLVVMPDGGKSGFYSDWYNEGEGGPPAYETFHMEELPPLIEERYRGNGRWGIAGASMGGFGAFSYAARHPEKFSFAVSLSGALHPGIYDPFSPFIVTRMQLPQDLDPLDVWGKPLYDEERWRGHSPMDLAPNLRHTPLFVSYGSGHPAPGAQKSDDMAVSDLVKVMGLEQVVGLMTKAFLQRAEVFELPVTVRYNEYGLHTGDFWNADMAAWMPALMDLFAQPQQQPDSFSYRSAESEFSAWGWSFALDREDLAFTDVNIRFPDFDFTDLSLFSISATGDGMLSVVTPPLFTPGRTYALSGALESEIVASAQGRLSFSFSLGETAEKYGKGPNRIGPRSKALPARVVVTVV